MEPEVALMFQTRLLLHTVVHIRTLWAALIQPDQAGEITLVKLAKTELFLLSSGAKADAAAVCGTRAQERVQREGGAQKTRGRACCVAGR